MGGIAAGSEREVVRPIVATVQTLIERLRRQTRVSADQELALLALFSETRRVPAGHLLARRGEATNQVVLLLEGVLCDRRELADGTRQIIGLHLPGDVVGLAGLTLPVTGHDIAALSPCRVALAPRAQVMKVLSAQPGLIQLLWFLTALEASIGQEWQLSLGQRDAVARTAHLFCEIHARLAHAGLIDGEAFDLPLTQEHLSQCLALSAVHTNRVLRELRERGVLQFSRRLVRITDLTALRSLAGFDPAFLHMPELA